MRFFDRKLAPRFLAAALFAVLPAAAQLRADAPPAQRLPLKTLSVKVAGHPLKVEVADSPAARSMGLMFREKMAPNDGMLFVFDEPGYHSMWMKNTFIPLSVAFIDAEGRILNILDMEPRVLDTHSAAGPARYAIETNVGWFAAKKIKAGDKVAGLPVIR